MKSLDCGISKEVEDSFLCASLCLRLVMSFTGTGVRPGSCGEDTHVCFGVTSKHLAAISLEDRTACNFGVNLLLRTEVDCIVLLG